MVRNSKDLTQAAAHTVCDPEAGVCAPFPHPTSFMPVTMGVVSRLCYLRPMEFISPRPSANTAIPLIGQSLWSGLCFFPKCLQAQELIPSPWPLPLEAKGGIQRRCHPSIHKSSYSLPIWKPKGWEHTALLRPTLRPLVKPRDDLLHVISGKNFHAEGLS